MPALSDALCVASGGPERSDGRHLRVPVALRSQTVETMELLDVTSTLSGTRAVLRARAGEVVAMPHTIPGRSAGGRAQDDPLLEAAASAYVLELVVDDGACAALRGQTVNVAFRYAYADRASRTSAVFMALDLPELVARACS